MTTNCSQLKMLATDGKMHLRDAMTTRDIFRLIESVPSSKAEPFKVWLANLGEMFCNNRLKNRKTNPSRYWTNANVCKLL